MTLLTLLAWRPEPAPEPSNGPSGGLSWLRERKPPFAYEPDPAPPRRRDEVLWLTP